jgi:hypothetical protein
MAVMEMFVRQSILASRIFAVLAILSWLVAGAAFLWDSDAPRTEHLLVNRREIQFTKMQKYVFEGSIALFLVSAFGIVIAGAARGSGD